MSKNKLRNTLIDFKQQQFGHKRLGNKSFELHYFYCQPKLNQDPPVFQTCQPKPYKLACLKCLFFASKALWVHHFDKFEED